MDPRVDLAGMRTELAWDRTVLAWLRTTIALMGAGVAFDKGAQWLHQARVLAGTAVVRNGHLMGLTLTAASTLLLSAICWQYLRGLGVLARIKGRAPQRFTPTLLAAVFVVLLGCAVFLILLLDQR